MEQILTAIGWLLVLWLSVSTIYSTYFHLKNYFSSSDNTILAIMLDAPSHEELMDKKIFLKRVVTKQIVKVSVIFILLVLILSPFREEQETHMQYWPEKGRSQFLDECTGGIPVLLGKNDEFAIDFCNCVLRSTIRSYPDPTVLDQRLPWDFVISEGIHCLKTTKKNEQLDLQHEYFLLSIFAFMKAFEIENQVETEVQQKEYESLLTIGVDLGHEVSNEFLVKLHPMLLNQYRTNLLGGGQAMLEGNSPNIDISIALEKLSSGADLVNDFSTWWNQKEPAITKNLRSNMNF